MNRPRMIKLPCASWGWELPTKCKVPSCLIPRVPFTSLYLAPFNQSNFGRWRRCWREFSKTGFCCSYVSLRKWRLTSYGFSSSIYIFFAKLFILNSASNTDGFSPCLQAVDPLLVMRNFGVYPRYTLDATFRREAPSYQSHDIPSLGFGLTNQRSSSIAIASIFIELSSGAQLTLVQNKICVWFDFFHLFGYGPVAKIGIENWQIHLAEIGLQLIRFPISTPTGDPASIQASKSQALIAGRNLNLTWPDSTIILKFVVEHIWTSRDAGCIDADIVQIKTLIETKCGYVIVVPCAAVPWVDDDFLDVVFDVIVFFRCLLVFA